MSVSEHHFKVAIAFKRLKVTKYLVNQSHTVWYNGKDSHGSVRNRRASPVLPGEILEDFSKATILELCSDK